MAALNIFSNISLNKTEPAPVWRAILRAFLLLTLILALLPLVACDDSSSSNNGGGDGGGSIVGSGGTLPDDPEAFSYVAGGSDRQTVDFFRIAGVDLPTEASRGAVEAGKRPVLVWFHGGGWVINDKTNIEPIAFEIAELAGFHLASVGYRLAGPTGSQDPWPGMIHEVKSAIRWLKLNSEMLDIDPNYIFTTGESAGAHLAAMIALSAGVQELEGNVNPGATSDVAGAVLFYGPYEFTTIVDQALGLVLDGTCSVDTLNPLAVWALLDCPVPDNVLDPLSGCSAMDLTEASPITHVDGADPPVFAANGTDDCFVPFEQVFDLQNALNSAGVTNEVSVTNGGEHDVDTLNVTAQQVVDFLDENAGE